MTGDTPEGPGRTLRRHLLAAAALSLAIALPHLTADLYGDERGHSLRYVTAGGYAAILRDPSLIHPPLFFLLAKTAVAVTGKTWAMRLPSLLAALALVPATAGAARVILGPRFAIPAAYAAALSPFISEFATEGRAYSLVLLFSVLSLWAFHCFLRRESRRGAILLAAVLVGGALTHFIFLMQAAFFALWYLARRRGATRLAIGVAAGFILCVLPFVILQSQSGVHGLAEMLQGEWSGGVLPSLNLVCRLAVALIYGYNLFLLGRLDPGRNVGFNDLLHNLPEVAGAGLVFSGMLLALIRSAPERRAELALLATGAALPVGLALFGGVSGWFLVREKHLAVVWIFALLLSLTALGWLWGRPWGRVVAVLHVVLVAFALYNGTFRADRYARRMNWTGLASALAHEMNPGDRVISYQNPAQLLTEARLPLRASDPREIVLTADSGGAGELSRVVSGLDDTVAGKIFVIYQETGRNILDPRDEVLGTLGSRRKSKVLDFGRNLKLYAFLPGDH